MCSATGRRTSRATGATTASRSNSFPRAACRSCARTGVSATTLLRTESALRRKTQKLAGARQQIDRAVGALPHVANRQLQILKQTLFRHDAVALQNQPD